MAITRSQIARQLMQEGGVPRQGYFLGKLVKKIKDDIIPNELKSPAGLAAAAALGSYGIGKMQPGADNRGIFGNILEGGKRVLFGKKNVPIRGGEDFIREGGFFGGLKKAGSAAAEAIMKPRFPVEGSKDKQSIGGRLLSGILGGPGLALASGLLAGALTKDKEDPLYTGQDVGLNLRDIGKLANITDPRVGQAIGLRFLPDVEARKFTPEQMAETFAANQPVEFTEKREQAQDGGIMGDQKDFEEFLQDMQNRDKQMLQDRILQDFEKFMKRKRMLENLPEAKDGGIMKKPKKMASAILGDESDDIAMQLFGKPVKELNPSEFQELMDYLDNLQKKFMAKGGIIKMAEGGSPGARYSFLINKRKQGILSPDEEEELLMLEMTFADESQGKKDGGIIKMAEGGMMDMGGMEMDLRGGGFVPMGRAEKADDVPARLSKNEFVFTADAVRAAGGGDVDKGADKMYATMKKLEDRVA